VRCRDAVRNIYPFCLLWSTRGGIARSINTVEVKEDRKKEGERTMHWPRRGLKLKWFPTTTAEAEGSALCLTVCLMTLHKHLALEAAVVQVLCYD
jgi:hypothetical protein